MTIRHSLIAAALAAVLGAAIVPALAQGPTMPKQGIGAGDMGRGMMSGGMMSGSGMSGCATMMQSMNGADGRPNSQWQKHPPGGRSMPN